MMHRRYLHLLVSAPVFEQQASEKVAASLPPRWEYLAVQKAFCFYFEPTDEGAAAAAAAAAEAAAKASDGAGYLGYNAASGPPPLQGRPVDEVSALIIRRRPAPAASGCRSHLQMGATGRMAGLWARRPLSSPL